MGFESEDKQEKHRFLAARAEQAEAIARECKEPLAGEAWVTIAKIWRLLADNYAEELK